LVSERVISLFLILFAGIIARKANIIDWAATKKLSALLLNITQPLLIITSFQIAFDPDKLKNGVMIAILSVAIHVFTAAAAFVIYKPIKNSRNIFEMSTVFCNCAFLGFPVLRVIFGGELGIFYGSFYVMFFNIFIWTYGVYLITREHRAAGDAALGVPRKQQLKKIFLNAGMIASVLGIVLFVTGARMPGILFDSAKSVGDMTFPLSMIIVGSLVADINLKEMFLKIRNYYYVFVKLIFMPVFIALICYALQLPPLLIYMGTIMTAMPGAANVAIFAETYDADSKTAAIIIGLSTLLSIGTISLVMYFLDNILKLQV
jgi:hypothetical protein